MVTELMLHKSLRSHTVPFARHHAVARVRRRRLYDREGTRARLPGIRGAACSQRPVSRSDALAVPAMLHICPRISCYVAKLLVGRCSEPCHTRIALT